MGTAPTRQISASMAAALAATVLAGVGAAPALGATTTDGRMPVTTSARTLATAVVPSATLSGRTVGTLAPAVRRVVRTAVPTDPVAAQVVRLVNVARADAGCAPLHVDARLATAARLHSEDMAKRNYFDHTSLDGRSPWDRIAAQGYAYGSGENIAAGYGTPHAVMSAWMKSPGHRANILNCSSRAIGVGIGKGGSYGTYWTQDFGTR
jgi:uncharacterized protein YkwD